MIEYQFYLKRFLQRNNYRLRQLATVLVAFVVVLTALLPVFRAGNSVVFGGHDVAPVETALVVPQPDQIETRTPELKAENEAPAKPRVVIAQSQPISDHLLSIQASIANMLEASSKLLVSEKKVVVGRGDTLIDLLMTKGAVPREDAFQVTQALGKIYNMRDMTPGREITVFFNRDPSIADPKFSGIRIEKDPVNVLTVNRDDKGNYVVKKTEKAIYRTVNGFRGTINNSLYEDAQAAGVPDNIIIEMIKMYSWNVDFQREVHTGDKFEVMYEEYKTEDGKTVRGRGNITYAKLSLGGNDMPFYRYEDSRGDADYYDDRGMSAKKPLMKTPIDGARLSSGFGMRKHPVLGYSKKHAGVDFAAPRGTPIYAAGDGVIVRMSPFSSYGNYVRIRHRAGLDTAYAHMSKFKPGLRSGARVKQGQVIGYVGTTGRSTGPHLHYEVIVDNRPVNPSTVKLPTGRALKGKELKAFQRVMTQARAKFNSFDHDTALAENRAARRSVDKVSKN